MLGPIIRTADKARWFLGIHSPSTKGKLSPSLQKLVDTFRTEQANVSARWPMRKDTQLIAIPARNEAAAIRSTLEAAVNSLSQAERRSTSIAVLLNVCTDDTESVVGEWAYSRDDVELVEVDGENIPEPSPDKVRVYVRHVETAGKLNALLDTAAVFDAQGFRQERVIQLDADTKLAPGLLSGLKKRMIADKLASVGPRFHCVDANGKMPDGQSNIFSAMTGSKHLQFLAGCLVMTRSDVFLAGYRAISKHTPGVLGEDYAFTTIVRGSGLKAAVHNGLVAQTSAAENAEQSSKQSARWLQALSQWEDFVGRDTLRSLQLEVHPLKLGMHYAKSVLTGPGTPPRKLLRLGEGAQILPGYIRENLDPKNKDQYPDITVPSHWAGARG